MTAKHRPNRLPDRLPDWLTPRALLLGIGALGMLVSGGAVARDAFLVRPAGAAVEQAIAELKVEVRTTNSKLDETNRLLAELAKTVHVAEVDSARLTERVSSLERRK